MKISELKQPYRRMADYLRKNVNKDEDIEELGLCFYWHQTDVKFWLDVNYGKHPEITHEIKTHFPPNFDFSGEVEDERRYNFAFKNNTEEKYTQLAKEGKFDELPDTCEFSEAVELEVWDNVVCNSSNFHKITGKFKGNYMDIHCIGWKNAQLPTPKIDFSEFKTGDVVEVVRKKGDLYYGVIDIIKETDIHLSFGGDSMSIISFLKIEVKSITKIK